jgi:uncharacterized protein with ParB-like and HNH nuclease domain
MGTITFDRRNVNDALQKKYTLPTYQREYKWTEKQFSELLTDLQGAFLENYKTTHGRKDIGSYNEYFLGTIITTELPDGNKSIIDGQQRLATLTLILAYFERIRKSKTTSNITNIDNLIRRELYGDKDYNLSFDAPRAKLFNLILDNNIDEDDLPAQVSSIPDLDKSSEAMFMLYNKIEYYLEKEIIENLLPYFSDYFVNKVMLFEIGVPSEQDAHRVFVTMNDRGLKLGPIDLLKGYLLSNIFDNEANAESHGHWTDTINSLKKLSGEEDSQFIKTWLRALFANTIRGKKRGDPPGDYEIIGDSYHRWVIENKEALNLNTSDDFQTMISEDIPKYARIYLKIKDAEINLKESMKYVFFNGSRNLTLQSMLLLSSICKNDTEATLNKKIKLVSMFLDIFVTSRVFNHQDNTYDNVRDPLFELSKQIRGKNFDDLKSLLKTELTKYILQINLIANITYDNIKRQDLLHVLARIATFLEDICSQTNSVGFNTYIDRDRASKTFDVEHILCSDIGISKADLADNYDFDSDGEYSELRNSIGSLVLLPRGRNRSLKGKPYSEKLSVYSTENILCQTLHSAFFLNNPTASEALSQNKIEIKPYTQFIKQSISERKDLYTRVASLIWNEGLFETV